MNLIFLESPHFLLKFTLKHLKLDGGTTFKKLINLEGLIFKWVFQVENEVISKSCMKQSCSLQGT